ncbi:nitrate- and nitrite sensing domain-containing protein [Streptomyces sp. NPDC051162]|uniref:sensor histidine kinase n=1 Tax=Streptomyces sp. NPDC051162 TaxID=3154747 RepID=UPI003416A31F
MRAPVRKKRLRGGERERQSTAVRERTARVRNRLTASVAVTALTVLAASTFGAVDATRELGRAQRLAALADADGPALGLAHSLADERDAATQYVAGGRADKAEAAAIKTQRAHVDQEIEDFRPAAPASLRDRLDTLTAARHQALDGDDALAVFAAYTGIVQALHGVADTASLHGGGGGDAAALPALGRAVEEDSATRALLLGAIAAHGDAALVSAAQRTAAAEKDALADFDRQASAKSREAYAGTVSGPDVTAAAGHVTRLTRPQVTAAELAAEPVEPVRSALSSRLDLMRQAESDLAANQADRIAAQRHDALAALELRAGLIVACLVVALFTGVRTARSITRPLTSLRLGARRVCADPVAEKPIGFKGRDDEFAETARAVDLLHETAVRQQERIAVLEGERTRLIAARHLLAEEHDALRERHQELAGQLAEEAAARTAEHPGDAAERARGLFVGLSLRTLGLVERQLAVIEGMETHETDPERLETLFTLDHLATRMRRNSENLLVLAGTESVTGRPEPVPLLDVLRASAGEIERYQRVRIQSLPPHARLFGHASEDVSHLVAELLENATTFSPPDAQVQLSGWLLETGDIALSVQDEGIGIAPDRLTEFNALLAAPDPDGPPPTGPAGGAVRAGRARGAMDAHPADTGQAPGLGLYVVARLAARHGIRVQLREQTTGGIAAVVVLPAGLLADGPPTVTGLGDTPPVPGAAAAPPIHLPGSIAEPDPPSVPGSRHRAHAGPAPLPPLSHLSSLSPLPVHPADPPTGHLPDGIRPTGPPPAAPVGRHARPSALGDPAAFAPAVPGQGSAQVTGNGLPRRTPQSVPQRAEAPQLRQGVDAEALRRKLAGFQRGAAEGRRDAVAEIAGRTTESNQAGPPAQGGTVEEARG